MTTSTSTLKTLRTVQEFNPTRHGLPPGEVDGTWQQSEVEFVYKGQRYSATTEQATTSELQRCRVQIYLNKIKVTVILQPRKHYYDDKGNPQYCCPRELWNRWCAVAATAGPIYSSSNVILEVLLAHETGVSPSVGYPSQMLRTLEDILADYLSQGFLAREFPLIFLDTA